MSILALSDAQLDALGEIGNIGAGKASTSLARMTRQVISLTVPETRIMPFDQLPLVASSDPEAPMIAAYVAFEGDAGGCLLLLFSEQQAMRILELLGLPVGSDLFQLPELHKSAIAEIGNIITSAYLDALATVTGLTLMPMPPGVAVGMTGAILDTIGAYLGQFAALGLIVHINIRSTDADMGLELLMIPQLDNVGAILAALGLGGPLQDEQHTMRR